MNERDSENTVILINKMYQTEKKNWFSIFDSIS